MLVSSSSAIQSPVDATERHVVPTENLEIDESILCSYPPLPQANAALMPRRDL